jgi:hypothetical protein
MVLLALPRQAAGCPILPAGMPAAGQSYPLQEFKSDHGDVSDYVLKVAA